MSSESVHTWRTVWLDAKSLAHMVFSWIPSSCCSSVSRHWCRFRGIWYQSHFISLIGDLIILSSCPPKWLLYIWNSVLLTRLRVECLGQFSLNMACPFDMWNSLLSIGKFSWILFISICSVPLFWFSSLMSPIIWILVHFCLSSL